MVNRSLKVKVVKLRTRIIWLGWFFGELLSTRDLLICHIFNDRHATDQMGLASWTCVLNMQFYCRKALSYSYYHAFHVEMPSTLLFCIFKKWGRKSANRVTIDWPHVRVAHRTIGGNQIRVKKERDHWSKPGGFMIWSDRTKAYQARPDFRNTSPYPSQYWMNCKCQARACPYVSQSGFQALFQTF